MRQVIAKDKWKKDAFGVWVTCPGCKLTARLDHDVSATGEVNPSLDCPECPYHEFVTLAGWDGHREGAP